MKKTAAILVFTVFGCILNVSYGQEDIMFDLPNVVPMSPEGASFAKHTENQVTLQSGLPSVNIPLHTLTFGEYSLPVGLSYHMGGIKVEEIASKVGLGWTLNAGGMISRVVMGLPDDILTGYMNTPYTVEWFRSLPDSYPGPRLYELSAAYCGFLDFESDVYSYSANTISGRFQYHQSEEDFIQVPYTNVKIEAIYNNYTIVAFKLTDPNGINYYFGKSKDGIRSAVETSTSLPISVNDGVTSLINSHQASYIESWMLMDIELINGELISFYYDLQPTNTMFLRTSETRNIAYPNTNHSHSISYIEKTSVTPFLKEIYYPGGRIEFEEAAQIREDINNHALDNIKIYNYKNELIKKYELDYSYFTSTQTDNIPFGSQSQRVKRLRLDAVYEYSGDNSPKPPYEFTYNNEQLPSRLSNSQDYWGYYNGKSNQTLIPKIAYAYNANNDFVYVGEADRTIDLNKNKAGSLKKIKFPEGGEVEYFMESNQVSDHSFVGDFPNFAGVTTWEYRDFANSNNFLDSSNPNEYQYATPPFQIHQDRRGPVRFKIEVMTGCTECCSSMDCDFQIQLRNATNDTILYHIQGETFIKELPPGNYKLTANQINYPNKPSFYVSVDWEREVHPQNNTSNRYFGGLRVSKIERNDGNGNKLTEEFNYNEFGTTKSSGYAISTPVFLDKAKTCSIALPLNSLSSQSHHPLTSSYGSFVGYRNITRYNSNDLGARLGKSEYVYNEFLDLYDVEGYFSVLIVPGSTNNYTYIPPPLHVDWLRGNLLEEHVYERNGLSYTKKKKVNYDYEVAGSTFYPNLSVSYKLADICPYAPDPSCGAQSSFKYSINSLFSEWHRVKKTTTEEYFPSGTVTTVQETFYDNNGGLPSHTETTYYESGSNVKTVEAHYQYPFDLLPHTQMQNLVNQNRISQPVKVTKKVNGTAVQTTNTVYATNTNTSGKTMPVIIQADKGNGTNLENRIHYERYDSKGNPLQVSMNSGPKIAYIWGYHDQFPVAKIENLAYNSIPSQLITNIKNASNSGTETQMLNALNALRNNAALSGAMVTTYMYKPLVGITRMIDPKGDEIRYYYDAFGRLDHIRDKQGNLLEEYEYNYREN